MKNLFLALIILLCLPLGAETAYAEAEPGIISERIVALLDLAAPLILDIQAGDLTSTLDYHIRSKLLARGADLRDLPALSEEDYGDGAADSTAFRGLTSLALERANLVRVTMELGGTTVERKSFLSYHSERFPLYTFQVRQISVPENRLRQIDNLSFVDSSLGAEGQPLSAIKWFEPVLAATALASLIYLLWTTE